MNSEIIRFSTDQRLVDIILEGLSNPQISSDSLEKIKELLLLDESTKHTYAELVQTYFAYMLKLQAYKNGEISEEPTLTYIIPADITRAVDKILEDTTKSSDEAINTQNLEFAIGLLIDRHNRNAPAPAPKPDMSYINVSLNELIDKIKKLYPNINANPHRIKRALEEHNIDTDISGSNLKEGLLRLYAALVQKDDGADASAKQPPTTLVVKNQEDVIHESTSSGGMTEDEISAAISAKSGGKFKGRIHPLLLNAELKNYGVDNLANLTYKEKLVKLYELLNKNGNK
jgi:hypothetical protein